MNKKPFIIDTDTASDDAVALVMAAKNPHINIKAITVVAGNVSLEQGIQNAMYSLSLCQKDIPIYAGMNKPMARELKTADHVHGKDGMGDIGLPLKGFIPKKEHAVNILIEKINAFPNQITLVCLGPLTNIATALSLDNTLATKVKKCIIMGGVGKGRGNVTPISEYNFWADPEAAKIVFESGMPIKMVGWDISRKYAVFNDADVERLRKIGTPLSSFCVNIQGTLIEYVKNITHLDGFDLPDPIAMAIALDPSIATETKKAFVSILLNDDFSRGQSVIDYVNATGNPPNAEIVLRADSLKFRNLLHQSLS